MPSATVMRIPRRSLPRSNGSRPGCARARRSRLARVSAAGAPRRPIRSGAHPRRARQAAHIYHACSFQDLTGQRTDKVIEALRFVEERIATMIDIWGKGPGTQTPEAPSVHARPPVGFPESLLDQSDVDGMLPAMPVE